MRCYCISKGEFSLKIKSLLLLALLAFTAAFAGCSSNTAQTASTASGESIEPQSDYVVYTDAAHKLHKSKADGTEDEIILDDVVLTPCKAGEWVYYFANLDEIDKVKMDGSQKTKVCDTSAMQALNANAAITAEYKDGYILYKLVQLREEGDESPNTITYYRLDINEGKITVGDN
jgi:hypothetical protein